MTTDSLLDDRLSERKAIFDLFGGMPEVTVQNTEWLYMLEQDTRHSLAIEGYFASDDELEAVLAGSRSSVEVTNYFRTAQTVYDLALQYFRGRDQGPHLDIALVRHVHSELFRNKDERRGRFRSGGIRILRARVQPPEFDIESYLQAAVRLMLDDLEHLPILTALARAHTLFESIHPFPDGNGRTGRILMNYLAIGRGYPPIIIKGLQSSERERYYAALEAADKGFHTGFPQDITAEALRERLAHGNMTQLRQLLCDGLLPRLERLIVLAVKARDGLMPLSELAARLGAQEPALRKRIERKTLLSLKEGGRIYSHPSLVLATSGQLSDVETLANAFSGLERTSPFVPERLRITTPDGFSLDAGSVALEGARYVIAPPVTPMVDQLLAHLKAQPLRPMDSQSRHLGIGMTALCVRWGSYLATLLDSARPLHPDLGMATTKDASFISQSEMRRINLEVSYAISQLAKVYHERGFDGLAATLTAAYQYLPMPQRAVQMNREAGFDIVAALTLHQSAAPERQTPAIPPDQADRAIANVLAAQGWRNTLIEDIHAGATPAHPLRPHERRLRPRQAGNLLHEVSANFAAYYFWFDALFGDNPTDSKLPSWPQTATALAHSLAGASASSWSLTEASAVVTLER